MRPPATHGLLLLASLAGCAAASNTVTLRHEVAPGAREAPAAGRVRVTAADVRPEAAGRGAEARLVVGTAPDPVQIGPAPADYTAAEPVEATFSKALEAELAARGFRIGADAPVVVRLEVVRFFSVGRQEGVLGVSDVAGADLELRVAVEGASGAVRYARTIAAHAQDPVGIVGLTRTGTVQAVLQRAMDEGLAELLRDDAFLAALTPPSGSS